MFVYYVVLLFPDGILLIHENTCLVLFLNSCTKCLKGKNKQNCEMRRKKKNASLHYIPHLPETHQTAAFKRQHLGFVSEVEVDNSR